MAEIVAAMAATHGPGITGWFDQGSEEDQRVVREGFGELRRRLTEARPDVLVMLSNDHLLNWPINNTPDYTVGIGENHVGPADWFDEWLGLDKYHLQGHSGLARHIVKQADTRGLKLAFKQNMEFDDGFSVPLTLLNPDMRIPLVPISMNCTVPPIPSTAQSYRTGEMLRDILLDWPGDERIAIVGTGGLSHEPGGPRYLLIDEAFDRWFLELLARGDHQEIVRQATIERMEEAGSGGTAELIAWIAVLPCTTGPAEVLGYSPAAAWRTGTGMVCWPVEGVAERRLSRLDLD